MLPNYCCALLSVSTHRDLETMPHEICFSLVILAWSSGQDVVHFLHSINTVTICPLTCREKLRPYKYPVPYQTSPIQPDLTSTDDSCPNNSRVAKWWLSESTTSSRYISWRYAAKKSPSFSLTYQLVYLLQRRLMNSYHSMGYNPLLSLFIFITQIVPDLASESPFKLVLISSWHHWSHLLTFRQNKMFQA